MLTSLIELLLLLLNRLLFVLNPFHFFNLIRHILEQLVYLRLHHLRLVPTQRTLHFLRLVEIWTLGRDPGRYTFLRNII